MVGQQHQEEKKTGKQRKHDTIEGTDSLAPRAANKLDGPNEVM